MASPLRGIRNVRVRQTRLVNRIKVKYPHMSSAIDTIQFDWYRIRNAMNVANEPERTEIFIYDEIGGPCSDLQVNDLVHEISNITTPEILVRINSPGGSVPDAIAIYNALVQHGAHVTTRIDAMCASAATVIAIAGHDIQMMLGSQMMIHEASTISEGNATTLHETADWLDNQSQNIAVMYSSRPGGKSADEWRALMRAETWMYGDEAITYGLADSMYVRPDYEQMADVESPLPELVGDTGAEDETLELMMRFDHVAAGRTRRYKHTDRAHAPAPVLNKGFSDLMWKD